MDKVTNPIYFVLSCLLIVLILLAVFDMYLKPGFVMNITNQLLTLCGW